MSTAPAAGRGRLVRGARCGGVGGRRRRLGLRLLGLHGGGGRGCRIGLRCLGLRRGGGGGLGRRRCLLGGVAGAGLTDRRDAREHGVRTAVHLRERLTGDGVRDEVHGESEHGQENQQHAELAPEHVVSLAHGSLRNRFSPTSVWLQKAMVRDKCESCPCQSCPTTSNVAGVVLSTRRGVPIGDMPLAGRCPDRLGFRRRNGPAPQMRTRSPDVPTDTCFDDEARPRPAGSPHLETRCGANPSGPSRRP